jgi:hypothetical protein
MDSAAKHRSPVSADAYRAIDGNRDSDTSSVDMRQLKKSAEPRE